MARSKESRLAQQLTNVLHCIYTPLARRPAVLNGHYDYVERVGGAVAAHAHGRLPYSFHLVPDRNFINAFSLPGGPVCVGEGMLNELMTEDELASLLAHGIEHIDHCRCVERVQIEANSKRLNLQVPGDLVKLPLELWPTGYHKDEELEADREGMFLAVRAGYSPYGELQLFKRFKLHNEFIAHAETGKRFGLFPLASATLGANRASRANHCAAALGRQKGNEGVSRGVRGS